MNENNVGNPLNMRSVMSELGYITRVYSLRSVLMSKLYCLVVSFPSTDQAKPCLDLEIR